MAEKWTPGPWSEFKYVGPADSWFIRGPNGERVCGSGSGPVSKANAHLIAAAPDLYEALTTARSQVVLLGGDAMEDEFGDAIQSAVLGVIDAALSHARGEQP